MLVYAIVKIDRHFLLIPIYMKPQFFIDHLLQLTKKKVEKLDVKKGCFVNVVKYLNG